MRIDANKRRSKDNGILEVENNPKTTASTPRCLINVQYPM